RSLMRKAERAEVLLHSPFLTKRIGMRTGNWKWISAKTSSEEELYDLKNDAEEKNNLAPQNQPILSSLSNEGNRKHKFLEYLFMLKKVLPLSNDEEDCDLNLDGQEALSDEELLKIVRPFYKRLKSLSLNGCWKVSGKTIQTICAEAKKLKHLDLGDC